jgi:4-aminobutyrate aminotransferase-like enzyme
MIGVELVKDKQSRKQAKEETDHLVYECFKRGLLILPCGPNGIRFSPPLIITESEADIAFEIFAQALAVVEGGLATEPVPYTHSPVVE